MAGFLVAAAPFPTRADNDEDSRHGHENNDKGIRAEIVALKAEVADLQNQVNSLQASNTTLKNQLAAVESNPALALGPFVTVDPNPENEVVGPNIIFKGANIHVVSGSGTTVDNNGTELGNLIIGYDELPPQGFPPSFRHRNRGGAHNLVIGRFHRFPDFVFGDLVAGESNTIDGEAPSVAGGQNNIANGLGASVSGGASNIASGPSASVSGGGSNIANGDSACVSGGESNIASGHSATVAGGQANTASGDFTSVSGGFRNTAGGTGTIVIGGQGVIDNNANSVAPQPPFP